MLSGSMTLDFDIRVFCQNLRATKPPYECPVPGCGRIYKSYTGIHFHLYHHPDSDSPGSSPAGRKPGRGRGRKSFQHHRQSKPDNNPPSPPAFFQPKAKEALTFAQAQKLVEIEFGGRTHRLNASDQLDIVFRDAIEPNITEEEEDKNRDLAKTPSKVTDPKKKEASAAGVTKVPEASFRILDNYKFKKVPPLPKSYYRFKERSFAELDDEVEYDMDEEDCAWLEIINEERKGDGQSFVPQDIFEYLMDRLEKESFFQSQYSGEHHTPGVDDDAVCCICNDGECQNSNVILFCDMCNLAVHQECYGVPYIPEGQWLCRRCLQSPSKAVDCVLCPNKGGAFKQTDDSRWAHVVCALWVPEVQFANTVFLEPIDSIENIPPARWKLTCYICKQRGVGACIQCHKTNCYTAFHVTCAQQADLFMKMQPIRESGPNGTQFTVRKTAFCDTHTPLNANFDEDDDIGGEDSRSNFMTKEMKERNRMELKKVRKILAEKRVAIPVVSIPTISPETLIKIAHKITITKKVPFLARLKGYWTLKRQSRNGVPLIRRLHTSTCHQPRRDSPGSTQITPKPNYTLQKSPLITPKSPEPAQKSPVISPESLKAVSPCSVSPGRSQMPKLSPQPQRTAKAFIEPRNLFSSVGLPQLLTDKQLKSSDEKGRRSENEQIVKNYEEEHLKDWRDLRKNLEQARLLVELVRKREKLKREEVKTHQQIVDAKLVPFNTFLHQVLNLLQEKDTGNIFSEPVDVADVPDYYNFIKHPMDFSKMRRKIDDHQYQSLDEFEKDFELIVYNCMSYNAKDTVFYRAALRLRDQGGHTLRQCKRAADMTGYDTMGGIHLKEAPRSHDSASHEKEEFEIMSEEEREQMSLKEQLEYFFRMMNKAESIKRGAARSKWMKRLKKEVKVVRRKIAIAQREKLHPASSDESDEETSQDTVKRHHPRKNASKLKSSHLSTDGSVTYSTVTTVAAGEKNDEEPIAKDVPEKRKRGWPKGKPRGKRLNKDVSSLVKSNKSEPSETEKKSHMPAPSTPSHVSSSGEGTAPPTPSSSPVVASPSGVSRRTAVLFGKTSGARKVLHLGPNRRPGRPRLKSNVTDLTMETTSHTTHSTETSAVSPKSSATTSAVSPKHTTPKLPHEPISPKPPKSPKGDKLLVPKQSSAPRSPGKRKQHSGSAEEMPAAKKLAFDKTVSPIAAQKESFQAYRVNSELAESASESDVGSDSSSTADSSSSLSSDESNSEGNTSDSDSLCSGAAKGGSRKRRSHDTDGTAALEPLDLVWAKCRGYPWYPALIINPKMPKTGYFHNGVPIPVPPDEVLELQQKFSEPVFLVLFFDTKRTWQWLPRHKLDPLGVNPTLDSAKLVSSRKPAERKAVRTAYHKAINHRRKVDGDPTLSDRDSNDDF